MTYILTITLCLHSMCMERFVETPFDFGCNDPQWHQRFIADKYPEWHFVRFTCIPGRIA